MTIFNRTRSKCEKLVPLGAKIADSPRQVAAASEIVITMVSDTATVEQVLFGENGVADGLKPGALVIDMSTISPLATMEFGERLAALGCDMLDAPVSGGPKGAIGGTLGIMVGGSRERLRSVPSHFSDHGENHHLHRASGQWPEDKNGESTRGRYQPFGRSRGSAAGAQSRAWMCPQPCRPS